MMERVYMVPEKAYHQKERQLSLPSVNNPLNALDKSLQDLNAQPSLPDTTRWKEYERILNAYFAQQKKAYLTSYGPQQQQQQETEDPHLLQALFAGLKTEDIQRVIGPIYQTLPKTLKDKGMQLMQFIAQTEDVRNGIYQVSSKGRILVHGREVPESNLLDLVHYAIRPRRKTVAAPAGWNVFMEFLRRNNAPKELVTLHRRHVKKEGMPIVFRPSTHRTSPEGVRAIGTTTDEDEAAYKTPRARPVSHQEQQPSSIQDYVPSWERQTKAQGKTLRSRVLTTSPYPNIKKPKKKQQTGSGYKRSVTNQWWSVYR